MKILTAQQIRETDAYTIATEPIRSIDLMERASQAFVDWFVSHYSKNPSILIIAGAGNNGGDALAVARLLFKKSFQVEVFLALPKSEGSQDYQTNLNRLPPEIKITDKISTETDVIIDGLFGSGLSREVEGKLAEIIESVNSSGKEVVSIDIASGLGCDTVAIGTSIIKPTYTISFQLPKLAFMLVDNVRYIGHWSVVDIGLDQKGIVNQNTDYYYQEEADIKPLIKVREKISHKGIFGHSLIIGGSYGKIGAIVLASKACLRSGAGLVTSLIPQCGYEILQSSVPEVMCQTKGDNHLESVDMDSINQYSAIGIGPGLGKSQGALTLLSDIIKSFKGPLLVDADALNLLAENPELIELLPKNSILTPHVGEFNRLVGQQSNGLDRLKAQQRFSKKHQLIIVLKGANTSISDIDGKVWFNSTGNAGMATAGSGDVLSGMITSFLGQGYAPFHAARIGVFMHGLAGDFVKKELGEPSIIASDLTERISEVFISLE